MVLSSNISASYFFSLALASCSAFSRLAPDISRLRFLAFHLWEVALLIPCLRYTPASPRLPVPQDPNDLLFLFCEPAPLHVHPPSGDDGLDPFLEEFRGSFKILSERERLRDPVPTWCRKKATAWLPRGHPSHVEATFRRSSQLVC
jgi:hypothetical protein